MIHPSEILRLSIITNFNSSKIFRCVFGDGDGTRLWVGDSGAHYLYSPQPLYEYHGTFFSLPTVIYVMLFFSLIFFSDSFLKLLMSVLQWMPGGI